MNGELLFIQSQLGRPTSFDHQLARSIAIELGDGGEEVEEVLPILTVQFGDETGVDEDDLWLPAFVIEVS